MQLVIEDSPKTVTVITPSIGSPKLADAIKSVENQTYKCRHLIVVDGPEYSTKTVEVVAAAEAKKGSVSRSEEHTSELQSH